MIYWPGRDLDALRFALNHCRQRRLTIDSIVRTWDDAVQVTRAKLANVIVIGTRGDLDPDRVPRWEIADEWEYGEDPDARRPVRLSRAAGPPPT